MNHSKIDTLNGNILIVDDTPENLQVLSATLSERGYKVRGVINGKMAIRAARSAAPDLILLDIKMPEMNGYQVCEALKAEAQTCQIPVIFISALDEVLDKVKAFSVGGVDYITKPFQVEEVLARVENQLTIQRLQKQLIERNEQLQQEIQVRQKAEAEALAASKAKSEFVANMSHELRTPLNAILGFTQLMTRDLTISGEQRESLEIISRSGEHLLELIDDVLEMSKIEAGIIALNETCFDLYCLLDNVEGMLQLRAEIKGLHLLFIVSSDVPQYVKTDQKKLRGCLINLIGNAIKFTNQGKVTLRVNVEQVIAKNAGESQIYNYLYFEVEDTGPGISSEEMKNLFQAFVQTDTGRKSMEGTGLGLAISRKYVQVMGGDISVSSILGQGTTFKFNIQIDVVGTIDPIVNSQQRVLALQPSQETYRILVVDDRKENRKLLVKLLSPIGFEVQEAENGQEAVNTWQSWQPHLIFMDTRMPVMNGVEAIKEIRTREKISREIFMEENLHTKQETSIISTTSEASFTNYSTTIITLTASAFEERRQEILAAGSNEFVRKPFTENIIFEKISKYLGITYVYEELTPNLKPTSKINTAAIKPDSFFLEKLAKMPVTWLDNLYQAANEVNEELVVQLIAQIPANDAHLSQALWDLVQDFRLDIIVRLIQSLKSKTI